MGLEPTDQGGREEILGKFSAGTLGLVLAEAGEKPWPLDSSNSWIHPHQAPLPARAFKWSGRLAEVCSAHPVGHCSAAAHQG